MWRREQQDLAKLAEETGIGADTYRAFDQGPGSSSPGVSRASTPLLGDIFSKSVSDDGTETSPAAMLPARPPINPAAAAPPFSEFVARPARPIRPVDPMMASRPGPARDTAAREAALRVPPRPSQERAHFERQPERPAFERSPERHTERNGERPRLRAVPLDRPDESAPEIREGRSSLDAIRGILSKREEPPAERKRPGPLAGLFDRLGR